MTTTPAVPPGWQAEISSWQDWMRAAGRASGTVSVRTSYVRRLAAFLAMLRPTPWTVTVDDLTAWFALQETWKPETRHSGLTSIRGFYAWGMRTGRATSNPAAMLARVPVHPGRPRPTPEDALAHALDRSDRQTRLMVQLAAYAGLRRAEIAAVRVADLEDDGYGHVLRVMGKGQRERLIPISGGMAAEMIRQAREAGDRNGWVFFNPQTRTHLTAGCVGRRVADALPDGWTAHTLRHRFASRAYAGERDLRAVQELLGHASVVTTQRYTAVPLHAMRRAVDFAS